MNQKSKDLLEITIYYVLAFILGISSLKFLTFSNDIIDFLIADCVMTVFIFICSLIKRNSSVYDAYWSVIPFYFVIGFIVIFKKVEWDYLLLFSVISLWSWRLTQSWARGWNGFTHEDFRYVDLAKKTKAYYPIVNFLGIHLFPTVIVFAGCLPLFHIIQNEIQSFILLFSGVFISLLGISFEFIADIELDRFRKRKNPQLGDILNTGIWGRSRNPNYLGEMLFWIGIAVSGFAYQMPYYYSFGAIALTAMFLFISIPMKDKRMAGRRVGYAEYKQKVPLLFPKLTK
jgi:steroid 5-alpha reductase family enzyme